jgi:hypothetical protein
MTSDQKPSRWVGVNDKGHRVCQYRHGAKFTDAEIMLVFELAYGDPEKGITPMKQRLIAEKFEVHESRISRILNGKAYAGSYMNWIKLAP